MFHYESLLDHFEILTFEPAGMYLWVLILLRAVYVEAGLAGLVRQPEVSKISPCYGFLDQDYPAFIRGKIDLVGEILLKR